MSDRWPKKQKRELRELNGLAWERELSDALRELRGHFDAWERGEISAFDVSDRIHEFHNGRSRELYNAYTGSLLVPWVVRAIVTGVLAESEISEDLHNALKPEIAYLRDHWNS
jgi:hypothetical protein